MEGTLMRCFSLGRMEIRMLLRRGDMGKGEEGEVAVGNFRGVMKRRRRCPLRLGSSPEAAGAEVCFSSALSSGEAGGAGAKEGSAGAAALGLSVGSDRRLLEEEANSALDTMRWVLSTPSGQEQVL
jgi:hypothetical protein